VILLDKSKSGEEDPKRASSKKITIRLSSREKNFLIMSDILIIGFITIDLFAFTGLININMGLLSLANLPMVAFTYYYYKFKKRITIRALRDADKYG
jgi:hypothetical protein